MDVEVPGYVEARQRILDACQRHNVAAGINSSTLSAPKRIADGFRMVLVTTDFGSMIRAVGEDVRSVRQASPGGPSGPTYQ
jgi:histidinol phosphatase-like PHP family hydrolase